MHGGLPSQGTAQAVCNNESDVAGCLAAWALHERDLVSSSTL